PRPSERRSRVTRSTLSRARAAWCRRGGGSCAHAWAEHEDRQPLRNDDQRGDRARSDADEGEEPRAIADRCLVDAGPAADALPVGVCEEAGPYRRGETEQR